MSNLVEVKVYTHTVFKNDDIKKYLSKRQQKQLSKIEATLNNGRVKDGKKINSYYICNTDEPYSKEVYNVIMHGELLKNA
jgi:hypothetical protein